MQRFLAFGLVLVLAMTVPAPAMADPVNLALNTSQTGFPSPLQSDPGWGGGSYPWQIVDGLHSYSTWASGLAVCWGCADAQATIDFGAPTTFSEAILWHHGQNFTPRDVWLDYWNGIEWMPITFTRLYGTMYEEGSGAGYAHSDIYDFSSVTGSKLRYSWDNDGTNIVGGSMIHGWLYEFEVYNTPVPEPASLLLFGTGLVGLRAWRRRK